MSTISLSPVVDFADELLTGDQLVEAVFGPQPDIATLKKKRRKLYRLASEVPVGHRLPLFRMGPRQLAARPSTLRAWLAQRERTALAAIGIETADPVQSEPTKVRPAV